MTNSLSRERKRKKNENESEKGFAAEGTNQANCFQFLIYEVAWEQCSRGFDIFRLGERAARLRHRTPGFRLPQMPNNRLEKALFPLP